MTNRYNKIRGDIQERKMPRVFSVDMEVNIDIDPELWSESY